MTRPMRMRDAQAQTGLAFAALAPDLSGLGLGPEAVEDAHDGWLALAPADVFLHPAFRTILLAAAEARPDVDVFYADDAALDSNDAPLRLKPGWNPALLHAQDYIGYPVIVRGSAWRRLGGLDPRAGSAALYDLVLRAARSGMVVDALRDVLAAHPGVRPHPNDADRVAALRRALPEGLEVLQGLAPRTSRVRRSFAQAPCVTLVVPTCQARRPDGRPHVLALLDSLAAGAWPCDRLSVLVGDDVDDAAIYGDMSLWPFAIDRVLTARAAGQPFNYAAKMNRLWRAAATEQIVLLNDDVEVAAPDWLEALCTFAVDEGVGGVGARLVYPDGTIQHAGMVGGILGVFAHPWIHQPADAPTYGDWARVQRDWSAVTGAVFATRRTALEAVNGFDERFALEYNDVDLCLRMRAAGLRIVQAPDALLVHHEKASRRERPPAGSQTAAFLGRWRQMILDDPAYHPGLSRDGFVVGAEPAWGAWYQALDTGGEPAPGQNLGDKAGVAN